MTRWNGAEMAFGQGWRISSAALVGGLSLHPFA
jgi:hypothetical protein